MNHSQSMAGVAPAQAASISFGMTLMMAMACGVAVANIYYNQPLLVMMQAAFPGQESIIGFVPTVTQLGYALGLLFLVPLGDRIERRRLILTQYAALALTLAGVALAPNAWSVVAASIALGVATSVTQQILPFAAELSAPERRGATIGTVMSGLLCGILLGRVLAGAVGERYGWRAMFWIGIGMAVMMTAVLSQILPRNQPKTRDSYGSLIKSLFRIWREEPALRRSTMVQACVFGSFSALWTTLTLHLDAGYHLSAQVAGLFGLVGAAGVLFAPIAGKVSDRRGPHVVIGFACSVMVVSWLLLGMWGMLAGLVVGILVLDFGAQSAQVSNQHIIQALRPEMRSRLNAILMGGMFIGGAAGSACAMLAWKSFGWTGVSTLGVTLAVCALAVQSWRRP
ncbi:MFS transporter [Duganella sp. sic0402]|uniref:MFS transporter n=1 Tax=Duganella sp. sic0402 TaxID=2854786 RepID=UPI001E2F89AA|nr:MFS transporter [Duganella sp. sic0402]